MWPNVKLHHATVTKPTGGVVHCDVCVGYSDQGKRQENVEKPGFVHLIVGLLNISNTFTKPAVKRASRETGRQKRCIMFTVATTHLHIQCDEKVHTGTTWV